MHIVKNIHLDAQHHHQQHQQQQQQPYYRAVARKSSRYRRAPPFLLDVLLKTCSCPNDQEYEEGDLS